MPFDPDDPCDEVLPVEVLFGEPPISDPRTFLTLVRAPWSGLLPFDDVPLPVTDGLTLFTDVKFSVVGLGVGVDTGGFKPGPVGDTFVDDVVGSGVVCPALVLGSLVVFGSPLD